MNDSSSCMARRRGEVTEALAAIRRGERGASDALLPLVYVVKLRFYAGLSNAEAAQTLDASERSVRHLWTGAKAWLRAELTAE